MGPRTTPGGYGPDTIDPMRRAAGYVDRILKGEKPADLPVQAPTKYKLIIDLKTAKALDLTIPDKLLALVLRPVGGLFPAPAECVDIDAD
jgi:ABC-type uncharacterized transport system substrate-binding protein